MHHLTFSLVNDRKIDLLHLMKAPELGDMIYLQSIRSGQINEDSLVAQSYKAKVNTIYTTQLAHLVSSSGSTFDAIVCVPSSRDDGVPYYKRIQKLLELKDLTDRFSKCTGVKSAEPNFTVDDIISAISYKAGGDESAIKSILIVDDSIASGATVVAMLHHLQKSGLGDCKVTVAVPALLQV